MSFLDNVKKTVTDAASSAQNAALEFAEITKLEGNIKREESEITDVYKAIGEIVYGMYAEGQEIHTSLTESCESIKARKAKIEELKAAIAALKED